MLGTTQDNVIIYSTCVSVYSTQNTSSVYKLSVQGLPSTGVSWVSASRDPGATTEMKY